MKLKPTPDFLLRLLGTGIKQIRYVLRMYENVTRARLLHSDYNTAARQNTTPIVFTRSPFSFLLDGRCKAGIRQLRSSADNNICDAGAGMEHADERKLEWKLLLVATDRNLASLPTCVENNLRLSIFLVKFEF
eukprot:scaffold4522_cov145-Skeletonema_marinoi.AAC.8